MQSYLKIPELPLEPPEPDRVTSCCRCCEWIYEGDEYFTLDGDDYCSECFETEAVDIMLEKFGAEKLIAERSVEYDAYDN